MIQNSKQEHQTLIQIPQNNKRDFFGLYLELLKDFPPLNKLRPKERKFVALLMYYKDLYKLLPDERDALIFSAGHRKKINKELGIADSTGYNMLKEIRKKKVLIGKNLISILNINPDKVFKLIFNFKIKDNENM